MTDRILHTRIKERLGSIFENPKDIPNYIKDNLHHSLRGYQEKV